jgi:ubiquinone/menaquinone biosynthesis C-methylase UbiE
VFIFNYSNLVDPFLREVRIFLPEFVGLKKEDKILDICSATGEQVFYYARSGADATGIDLDQKMIELARKKKKEQGLNNVSFLVADARKLPFQDSFFDSASICLGLHQLERSGIEEVISEMKRVVKKNGHLVFIDFSVPLPKSFGSFVIKSAEFLVGRKNFHNFRDYCGQGGLPFILKKSEQQEEKIEYLKINCHEQIMFKEIRLDPANSRIFHCKSEFTFEEKAQKVFFDIRLPLRYPYEPPIADDFGFGHFIQPSGEHKNACLGQIKERWDGNGYMGIAHFLLMLSYYTALALFTRNIE